MPNMKSVRYRKTFPISISKSANWPGKVPKNEWWQGLADRVRKYPTGQQTAWGIPFSFVPTSRRRVIMLTGQKPEVKIPLNGRADYVCIVHEWAQIPETVSSTNPQEGIVIGEYELFYTDGTRHLQPVRGRFEVPMIESPGPAWLAMPFNMWEAIDPAKPDLNYYWGYSQYGLKHGHAAEQPPFIVYAMPNPHPGKKISSIRMRGCAESPLLVEAVTLYQGTAHPFRHLVRRTYRLTAKGQPASFSEAKVDLGILCRTEHTSGRRDKTWLKGKATGTNGRDAERKPEKLLEITAAEDAVLDVTFAGRKTPVSFSIGDAFQHGVSRSGNASLEVLNKRRQWMHIRVIDTATGKPTPVRIHFSGAHGEYLAPHGHHAQVNANWFEDYGADVTTGGRNYAYVSGEFTTDMPIGDVYVEICKGFEYKPVRKKISISQGQKNLELKIERWKNLRRGGWVTADTHVHFVSPQTAWLEAQCEGVNIVNLLASQWGRLFTNVGDYTGRVGVVENDTIVYVGTENRNHMLGHMSMLGTKGLPVYPMCCGGPTESWIGDPDFMTLAEWALENRRKGGLVIRPHFPWCGNTEDPVPILKGLVDALELHQLCGRDFPMQEWYRYLNCGYRVAVVSGTDKMGAYVPIGALRTYARVNPNRSFTYESWAAAVRAGRTVATSGPLLSLRVDGKEIGDVIRMSSNGGSVEVQAVAESAWPLSTVEVVNNGKVVACHRAGQGATKLAVRAGVQVQGSGWIAARCSCLQGHPAEYMAAHTSPVYITCGSSLPFDGPAAQHMLSLVEGGMEYLNTLATVFDEASRKRMVKLFKEAQRELQGRLLMEGNHSQHHGDGIYHQHGHGGVPHRH